MKKRKYLLLTLILSLLWINDVNAECSKEIKETFEQVKDKYKIDYVLDKTTKTYTLTLYYDDSLHYVYDFGEEMEERQSINSTDKSLTFGGIKPGKYEINVIVNPTICDEQLKTIKLDLPKYNIYYDDPLCKGNEEFYLCQETYDKDIDRETFESRINTYKKTKIKKEEQEKEKNKDKNIIDEVNKYVEKNLIEIIIIVVFIILLTITTIITAKSIRKSRRLE